MQRLEVSGAVRPIYVSLGVKMLRTGREVYWIVTYGRKLLSGPKLTPSCSVY